MSLSQGAAPRCPHHPGPLHPPHPHSPAATAYGLEARGSFLKIMITNNTSKTSRTEGISACWHAELPKLQCIQQ